MKAEEYIASGILEQYAMGELSESEQAAVTEMAARHPEVATELRSIEKTLEGLAFAAAAIPPTHVRANVMNATSPETSENSNKILDSLPEGVSAPGIKKQRVLQVLLTVASVLVVGFFSVAVLYRNNLQNAENQILALQDSLANKSLKVNSVTQLLEKREADMGVLMNTTYRHVIMKGLQGTEDALARLYWNNETGEVWLEVHNLPPCKQGMRYQLWAIVDDSKMMNAGMFDPMPANQQGLVKMKKCDHAQAFAVTLEPAQGSSLPTSGSVVHGSI